MVHKQFSLIQLEALLEIWESTYENSQHDWHIHQIIEYL